MKSLQMVVLSEVLVQWFTYCALTDAVSDTGKIVKQEAVKRVNFGFSFVRLYRLRTKTKYMEFQTVEELR